MFRVLLIVRFVQCVEQRRVDDGARPDHARRPHEEPPKQASKGVARKLGGEADHDLVTVSEVLLVEKFLRQHEVAAIGTPFYGLGHHSDDGMLLDVERTRIQGPDVAEGFEPGGWESPLEEPTDWEGK